ncbi:small subunit ribosomal protein S6 [Ferrithrix thermotolerans DSM 19514]|uniref:Small ribosomal subunit protein bS6 n=1 Tax=Ferrithrix thermotolerans DSM 19514 TaxID=1121881 RepID=A0A1M4WZB5_9ACTN|nr:30S ribosomal protein S6 [Ferrithrix thermotolerans]SHE86477.1 small subunit ribosomal protein S6 [Ferrithrix thermotolerans DSM 19514]
MRVYEIVVILDSSLEDDQIDEYLSRIDAVVSSNEGGVLGNERWGRRRFSYEINHRSEGYYVIVRVQGVPATVAELDRTLSISDEVIRHKVIRLPEKVAVKYLQSASASA